VLAIDVQQGLTDAWDSVATFVPKFVGFLVILLIGYIVAKVLAKVVNGVLERVGFDRWVERGSLQTALARSRFDASDILATLTFWTVFLIALQLAFGAFGPNPVSDLLHGLIAFLPRIFVAVVILVIAAALAKVATDMLTATLGAVSGGEWIARAAGAAILVFGVFAALNELLIAPAIVNGLYYAILVAIAGAFIVAVGGGGIRTMQRYWERASSSVETKTQEIKQRANVDAAKARAGDMKDRVVEVPESDTRTGLRPM
jgi:Conserved TM helix